MKYLYRTYQLLIALPLIAIYTVLTCLMVIVGCAIGNGHFWGYYPGKWWAQFIVRVLMLPVKVEGREHLEKGQSYVFVANHQGSFDIFLIYGFLCRNFKWMMKRQLRQMPFVGKACEAAHTSSSTNEVPARYARHTTKHARRCRAVCRWWFSQREHALLQDTWVSLSEAPLCLPTTSTCPLCH